MEKHRYLELTVGLALVLLISAAGCSSVERKQTSYTRTETTTPTDAWETFKANLKKVLPRKAKAPPGCAIDMLKPYHKEDALVTMQNYYQHKNNDPNVIVSFIVGTDRYGRPIKCPMTEAQEREATGCYYGIGCG